MIRQCTNDQSSFTYIEAILQRGNLFKFQLTRVCLLLLVSAPATWIDMHSYDTSKRKLYNKGCEPPAYFKQQIILELHMIRHDHYPIKIENKNNKFQLFYMKTDFIPIRLKILVQGKFRCKDTQIFDIVMSWLKLEITYISPKFSVVLETT